MGREIKTAQDWRDFYKSPGAIATCETPQWLAEGCPKCGCKKWDVTDDCWAYCCGCAKGFPTDYPFTRSDCVETLDFHETPSLLKGGR